MFYSLYILKNVKRQFYCVIMRRYFRDGLCFFYISFSFFSFIFYLFLLAFYFRTLILYTTDFDPRINKDIIIIKWVKDNFKCTSTEFISIRKQKLNSYAA